MTLVAVAAAEEYGLGELDNESAAEAEPAEDSRQVPQTQTAVAVVEVEVAIEVVAEALEVVAVAAHSTNRGALASN